MLWQMGHYTCLMQVCSSQSSWMGPSYGRWISVASFQRMSTGSPHSRPHYKLEKPFSCFPTGCSWSIDSGVFVGRITRLLLTTVRFLQMGVFALTTLDFLPILPITDSLSSLPSLVKSTSSQRTCGRRLGSMAMISSLQRSTLTILWRLQVIMGGDFAE